VRLDEDEAPENEAEEAVIEEMAVRNSTQTAPETPADRDDPTPLDFE